MDRAVAELADGWVAQLKRREALSEEAVGQLCEKAQEILGGLQAECSAGTAT